MFTRTSREISVIVIGSPGTGKSSLSARLLGKKFPAERQRTNGIHFTSASHLDPCDISKTLKLHIADTSGDRSFSDIVASYLVDVNAVIFVVDPTIFTGPQFKNIIDCLAETCQEARLAIVISKADTLETEDDRFLINSVVRRFIEFIKEKRGVDFYLYSISAKDEKDADLQLLLQHVLALPGKAPKPMTVVTPAPKSVQLSQFKLAPSVFSQPMKLPPLHQIMGTKPKLP